MDIEDKILKLESMNRIILKNQALMVQLLTDIYTSIEIQSGMTDLDSNSAGSAELESIRDAGANINLQLFMNQAEQEYIKLKVQEIAS